MAKTQARARRKTRSLNIARMQAAQRVFVKARDWEQFHTLKNLAVALSVEASELLEILQWKTEADVEFALESQPDRDRLAEELSDVLYYLLRMADLGGFDLEAEFWKKMKKNQKKYPVRLSKGHARKWTELTSKPK